MKRKMFAIFAICLIVFLVMSLVPWNAVLPTAAPQMAAQQELYTLPAGARSPGSAHVNTTSPDTSLLSIDVDSRISGDQQVAYVSPSQTINVTAKYWVASPTGQEGAIWQLLFIYSWTPSWPPPPGYYAAIYNGGPGPAPGVTGDKSFTLTAPSIIGAYYLWFCFNQMFTMEDAVNDFETPMWLPAHAKVIVESAAKEEWTKYTGNPVVSPTEAWEDNVVGDPSVRYENGVFYMVYAAYGGNGGKVGLANSTDAINWKKYAGNPVFEGIGHVRVVRVNTTHLYMYCESSSEPWIRNVTVAYSTDNGYTWTNYKKTNLQSYGIIGVYKEDNAWHALTVDPQTEENLFYWSSSDGINWLSYAGNPVLRPEPPFNRLNAPFLTKVNGRLCVWYAMGSGGHWVGIGRAFADETNLHWTPYEGNPVLQRDLGSSWEAVHVGQPFLVEAKGVTYMFYNGMMGDVGPTRIGIAYMNKTLSEVIPPLHLYVFDVTWGRGMGPYTVTVFCNHSVALFNFNKTLKHLGFAIMAYDSDVCDVTIPRCRLDGPFSVAIDEAVTVFDVRQDDTTSTLSFTYASGTHYTKITGTERGYIIGDVNGDGEVNIKDIFIVAKNFGKKEENYP